MADSETVVVLGVLAGLVAVTVLPFAIPAVELGGRSPDPTPTASPGQDKVAPAAVSPATPPATPPVPVTDTRTPTPGSDPASTGTPTGPPTLSTPDVRCQPTDAGGLPTEFPITLDGEPVTGQGVSVAVIDPSGFDVDDQRFAEHVAATRSFRSGASADIANGGANDHGTESAALVSRVAPGADLYLANFRKAVDFTRAVDWAIDEEVDVIVTPVAFYAKPNDGSAPVSRAVTAAMDEGIPVVAPTGNVATQHWEGTYAGDTWVEFAPNDTRLYLRGSDRPVKVWLWWNETAESGPNEFRVVLYRDTGDGPTEVATSRDYPKGPVGANQVLFEKIRTNNLLATRIENGTYFLRIRGPPDVPHRVELVAAAHEVESPVRRGSVMAPATAEGPVIAVGATDAAGTRVLESSSRGPTNDARVGIDLVAPGTVAGARGATFTGTSAATAYTGGVVALLRAVEPGLPPARTEAVLQATAIDPETDPGVFGRGHGLIQPRDALACLDGAN